MCEMGEYNFYDSVLTNIILLIGSKMIFPPIQSSLSFQKKTRIRQKKPYLEFYENYPNNTMSIKN